MYFLYVDESGDAGLSPKSPTRYFALSGVVLHELRWLPYLEQMLDFRRRMKALTGLKLREEIHAGHMLSTPGKLARIPIYQRLQIIRNLADELVSMKDITVISVLVDKQGKAPTYNVFENAWKALLQRFENTLSNHNFSGPRNPDDTGVIFPDFTHTKILRKLIRKIRYYNPVPNQPQHGGGYRNLRIRYILEDPSFRLAQHSYFIQAADVASFLLYQYLAPSRFMQRQRARRYFERLEPILCKVCSPKDPFGIVRL